MVCIQAWALRRMISVYNSVTRRPHVPREKALRRILISQGFDIPLESPPRPGPVPGSSSRVDETNGGEAEEGSQSEGTDSESFTDDESVIGEESSGSLTYGLLIGGHGCCFEVGLSRTSTIYIYICAM